jgi:broad specificity phosphatase PhoE
MNQTEFYFIRHGETETNQINTAICGVSYWAELTAKGKEQARLLGRRLKAIKFDHYYSSDIIRTQQTARYCLEAMGNLHQQIVRDKALVELTQGDWEGKPREEIYSRDIVKSMIAQDNWNFIPGDQIKGESQQQVASRMVTWINKKSLEHANKRILVFSHGLAIKYLLTELFDRERSTAFKIPIENTSLTIITHQKGQFSCSIENDISHLSKIQ